MKTNWEEKSNNEILVTLKQLQLDYEAQKMKTVREFDKLTELERIFKEASDVMNGRLKGKK